MRNETLSQVLVLLLGGLALGVAVLAYQHVRQTQRVNFWQAAIVAVEMRENRFRAMAGGAAELAARDPALGTVLSRAGVRPSGQTNPPAATSGR